MCSPYLIVCCIENRRILRHVRWQCVKFSMATINGVHWRQSVTVINGSQIVQQARAIAQLCAAVAFMRQYLGYKSKVTQLPALNSHYGTDLLIMHHSQHRPIDVWYLCAQQQMAIRNEIGVIFVQNPFDQMRTVPRIAGQLQVLKGIGQYQFTVHMRQIVPAQIDVFEAGQILE